MLAQPFTFLHANVLSPGHVSQLSAADAGPLETGTYLTGSPVSHSSPAPL